MAKKENPKPTPKQLKDARLAKTISANKVYKTISKDGQLKKITSKSGASPFDGNPNRGQAEKVKRPTDLSKAHKANKTSAANKLKAQGAKINKTPVDGYNRRGKK